ncbi:hypothetical protein FA048_06500 [Pedobacter polaris]|uniref:Uncharacterized protein n=1 Tax=Pedobacter polaris TaxID=2571273 RepID=A0A4U1CUP7_9SPHI|nr:hypothetical protein [Pedobacter polaris]TKC09859.1 hypothetical protein FA048_06500 [Pedobacter polaris]
MFGNNLTNLSLLSYNMSYFKKIVKDNIWLFIKVSTLTLIVATALYLKGWTLAPEVWGTVADWIMIIVTGLTAIFLYQSLKSQQDVQKMQQSITVLEQYSHILNIRPDFKCSVKWLDQSKEFYIADLTLEITENIPFKLKHKFVQTSEDFEDISGHKGMIDWQSTQVGSTIPFRIRLKTLSDKNGLVCSLDLFFEDAIGTGYLTKFMILSNSPNGTKAGPMIEYFPEFIISDKLKNLLRGNTPEQLAQAKKIEAELNERLK